MTDIPCFTRKFQNPIRVGDVVWLPALDCSMIVKCIRVDSLGRALFDLETLYTRETWIARFEEILEIYR